jgi:hypothetical protein
MYELLKGMRVIEGASFIAGPSCGLHLAQMGAEVIRFDDIRGGPDSRRWPLSPRGASFYWEEIDRARSFEARRARARDAPCNRSGRERRFLPHQLPRRRLPLA